MTNKVQCLETATALTEGCTVRLIRLTVYLSRMFIC